ncbi:MAG TPA: type II toxin-antitoxin system VapC family toxin [Acetobacteraceae bacterium]|nr:type II toxin-antitoxin system VapC family toxin [Acetobacteraceae bacterium]
MSDPAVVLDASALLALLLGEKGAERVVDLLPRASVSAVNLSEVAAKLGERGMPELGIRTAFGDLDLDVHAFDQEAAFAAGLLRQRTRDRGLSLGDRACLALALRLDAIAATADQAWAGLALDGLRIELVR